MSKYTMPKRKVSPFFESKRLPRKLKQKIKAYCGVHFKDNTNGARLWHYMEKYNFDYKMFLIHHTLKRSMLNPKYSKHIR